MRARSILTAFLTAAALASAAFAQEANYPTHAVRLIVASGPGGNPDVLGRILAERMTQDFGAAFVVENVTGAGGALAAITTAKAAPDGYTLLSGDSGTMSINPALNPKIGYDPTKDFTPITALVAVPTILVANPKVPAAALAEFIALA
jgi:tripartite-type tricarboxylate transporter receptor subunit TctC